MPFIGFARDAHQNERANMRKIDIHCHTTRSALRNTIPTSATLEAIEEQMRRHKIDYTVVLATYFPKEGKGISNYRLLHWLQGKPGFKLFGSLDFQHYYAAGLRELTELAEEGHLSGIKIYAGYQKIDFASKYFQSVAKLAQQYHLPMMFHGGFIQCHEDDVQLAVSPKQFSQIAHHFSEVPMIISHLAWPFVRELIELVLSYDNIFTDMSGMLDSFKMPHTLPACVQGLKHFLEACGPGRLLFGTDFPIQTHADSIQLVELAMTDFSEADRELVYYGNAKNILNIG